MSLYGSFAKHLHLSELDEAFDDGQGTVLTPAQRRAATRGNMFSTDAVSFPGGVAPVDGQVLRPHLQHTGGIPPRITTDGTDSTPVNTEVYIGQIMVPGNMTITGVAILNGSAVAGNVKVGLADSTGAVVATSASTAQAGTGAYQRVPFTATYAAKGPATYYVLAIFDTNTTPRFRTHTFGNFGAAKQITQVFGTGFTAITPPTTFTASLAPIASAY